jgi:hypothetical protein
MTNSLPSSEDDIRSELISSPHFMQAASFRIVFILNRHRIIVTDMATIYSNLLYTRSLQRPEYCYCEFRFRN